MEQIQTIYYINLAHRKDRKKHITSELNKLNIPKEKIVLIEAVQDLMNGHRGCALSHIRALEEAQKQGGISLIVEDDCKFVEDSKEIYSLCNYFFSTLKNNWDVFMLGARIKKHAVTEFDKIYRILYANSAHAYCIHPNYIPKMLISFKNSLALMQNDLFSSQSLPHAIDIRWKKLQQRDRWYITKVLAHQIDSYSDIEWRFRSWEN